MPLQCPARGTTYLEKCRLVATELESIAKQYALYVQHGKIDPELLGISSRPVQYSYIPSLIEQKYVYPKEDSKDIKYILHHLFSDQSGLGYIREGLSEPTLFDLLKQHDSVKYEDFENFQKTDIRHLIDLGLLKNKEGVISFGNKIKVKILLDVHLNDFLVYSKMDAAARKEVDAMIKKNYLSLGNTLLATQEADYFDYYLNKKFTNGLELRNSYSHGTQSSFKEEAIHKMNYMTMLKLLILLTIKINDELCHIDNNRDTQ